MNITTNYTSPEIQVLRLITDGSILVASNLHDLESESLYFEEF